MIDIVLGALALAAFGGLTVAADRKIKSLQVKKKQAGELEDGIYFGKIVANDFQVSPFYWRSTVRLDDGREIRISADESGLRSTLHRLKVSRWEGLLGTPVLVLVELGVPQLLAKRIT
jgi:hypothetical protein